MLEQTRVCFGHLYTCNLVENSFQSALNLEGWKKQWGFEIKYSLDL